MTIVPHPPYSPDLVPCDFCLQDGVKGREIYMMSPCLPFLKQLTSGNTSNSGKRAGCIKSQGDYFEGDKTG
jgi:hypothetical protein